MIQSDTITISKNLVKIISELGKTSAGKSFLFAKNDTKIVTSKRDDASNSIFIQLEFDNFTMSYPEKTMAFKDISSFFRLCDLQGLGKDSTFELERVEEDRMDGICIKNSNSELFYRLSNPDSTHFDENKGFGYYEDCLGSDPVTMSFDLSALDLEQIFKVTQEVDPNRFSFKREGSNVYLVFKGKYNYTRKLEGVKISKGFNIDESISFKYPVFEFMKKCESGFAFEYLHKDSNHNLRMTSRINIENECIDVMFESPSRSE